MSGLLAGKSAAITGGVTGIGKAIALEFLRQGASVTVNHLDDKPSKENFDLLRKQVPAEYITRLQAVAGDIGLRSTGKELVNAAGVGGSIIGISSISAHLGGAQQVHYTPTKAAVLSMMQSQACALGKFGIRCNALLPGTTRTQLAAEDLKDKGKLEYLERRTPLGRVAEPEDIAGPAVFLASDLSKFVNGAQILVDGGCSVSLQ
ncbi:L-rhamnose-1-dehydrogenase, partial [Pseudocercospora fuligena]